MYGLKIDLQSFKLSTSLIKGNDKVRVSITTFPEGNKEAVIINAKNVNYIRHFFQVNITDETNKIVFVFRKKSFIQNDPIIATAVITSKDFPLPNKASNKEIKTFYLYEYLRDGNKNKKMFGEMQIQFQLTDPFPVCDCKNNNFVEKVHKGQGNSKIDFISNLFAKNRNNNAVFLDSSCN